jgi:hypothetical protein
MKLNTCQQYLIIGLLLIGSAFPEIGSSKQVRRNLNARAILLYHVTSSESIKIIDKAQRVSLITEQLENPHQNNLPNLYSRLYSTDQYMLLGTREKILNVTLATLSLNGQENGIRWESGSGKRQCPFKPDRDG